MNARGRTAGLVAVVVVGLFAAACTVPPTVVDTTAPVLSLPGDLTVPAVDATGATVSYVAEATDDIDGPVAVDCTPESGATFAVGVTTVGCEASDAAGNTTTGGFTVTVETYVSLGGAVAVTAGLSHSCALLAAGTVSCWGNNSLGQLGNGAPVNLNYNNNSHVPVAVDGIDDATAISAGARHACALLDSGSVSCWGWNHEGQLGNGTTANSTVPVPVTGITNAVALSAGVTQTCAVLDTGTAVCWGRHTTSGSIGSHVPVPIDGITNATAIAAGTAHSCAVLATGGVVCWGWNQFGELGDETVDAFESTEPVPVTGIATATAVTVGEHHSCALLSGGTMACWGRNSNYGQLGNGTTSNSDVPVTVSGVIDATSAGAGDYHSCALLAAGTVSCWGGNTNGALGDGTNSHSSIAVEATGIANAVGIGIGIFHSCAVLDTGTVTCWGSNSNGQLGNVHYTYIYGSTVPVPVLVAG